MELIPDGCAVVKAGNGLAALAVAYGDGLYLRGSLTLRPADAPALAALKKPGADEEVTTINQAATACCEAQSALPRGLARSACARAISQNCS